MGQKVASCAWASLPKARGGPIRVPWRRRLSHYLRRPVQIPNIPAVILTIAALASASHRQAPQRARRHGPELLFCACSLPGREGGLAHAPPGMGGAGGCASGAGAKAAHRPLPSRPLPPKACSEGAAVQKRRPRASRRSAHSPGSSAVLPTAGRSPCFIFIKEKGKRKLDDDGIQGGRPCVTELVPGPAELSRETVHAVPVGWTPFLPDMRVR